MSRSYWLPYLAVVLILLLTALASAQEAPEGAGVAGANPTKQTESDRKQAQDEQPAKDTSRPPAGKSDLIKSPTADQRERDAEQRAKDDLEAQKGMAEAAWWLIWLTLAGLALTLAGLILIGFTLYYTRRAAIEAGKATVAATDGAQAAHAAVDATREIGVAQVRAYVTISAAAIKIDSHPRVAFTLHNSGNSPALNLQLDASATIHLPSKGIEISNPTAGSGAMLGTLRQGETVKDELWISTTHIPSEHRAHLSESGGRIHVRMMVTYVDVFGTRIDDDFAYLQFTNQLRNGTYVNMFLDQTFMLPKMPIGRR